ncbi:MAG TPA: hypothetical protein VFU81_09170, partial [Thermomicrobiales bacterium]|nr:hypothetical protein [Thermomicrobiales bacterium]
MAATARTLLEIEPRAERRFRALPRLLTRQRVIRALIVINLLLGAHYLFWRYTDSINWRSWPLAFALLAAETYSFVGAMLFGLGMWRWRRRSTHPRPRGDETVDV